MAWRTLVQAPELVSALGRSELVLLDCRFALGDALAGRRAWQAAHLPEAQFADLDQDLSDHRRQGHGRHPLPDAEALCRRLAAWGISPEHQVVAYDAGDGAMAAARLWALLRLLGHERVAVLDGGLKHWQTLALPLQTTAPRESAMATYEAAYDNRMLIETPEVLGRLGQRQPWLIDARAPARFRGEVEPLDPVAGHVPGAVNRPYTANLGDDGRLLPVDTLRAGFAQLGTAAQCAVMCGSGVTACHHLLAMAHAGIEGARLYADSWSGWISDSERPIALGE